MELEDEVVVVEEKEDDDDVDVIVVVMEAEEAVEDRYLELTSLDFGRRGREGPLLSASEGNSGARFALTGDGPRDDTLALGVMAVEDTLATIISHPPTKIRSFKP